MCTFAAKGREKGGRRVAKERRKKQISNLRIARSDQCQSSFTNGVFLFFPHDFEFCPHIFNSIGLCRNAHLYYIYHAPLLTEAQSLSTTYFWAHNKMLCINRTLYVFSITWYLVILLAFVFVISSVCTHLLGIYLFVHIFSPGLCVSRIPSYG